MRPKVAAQWCDLGAQLISDDKLKIIEYDEGKHAEACCSRMFQVWLQVDVTASWVKLVKALRKPSVAHNPLADEIEVRFTGIVLCLAMQSSTFGYAYRTRDESILLFFSPIFLSSNSFFTYLFCSIFCLSTIYFAP